MTDAEVMRELVAREPIFHRPEWGTGREDFARMTAPDYWEVGASGKVYEREICAGHAGGAGADGDAGG